MTVNEYQRLAMATLNPELSKRDVLINSVMGLCGESGVAIDIVKNGWHRATNWTKTIWPRNWATSPGIWRKLPPHWTCLWKKSSRPI